jgi:MFS family permease
MTLTHDRAPQPEPSAPLSPLGSYRRLLHLAGPAYVLVAFLGRLPLAMSQLGTLLLVSTATGSYGLGGLSAGALAVANAVGSPVAGALADRVGQRPVVLAQSLAGALGLSALVAVVHAEAGSATTVAVAALTGLTLPAVGPLARVRWRPITEHAGVPSAPEQRRLVDAAFSYEGAADEASFAIGPALIGLAAVAVSPGGALLVAAGLLAVFGTAFALDPSARLAHRARAVGAAVGSGRLLTVTFAVLALGQLSIGMLFGGTQTGATVLATEAGQPGVAGLVHATLGVGSAVAGIATAYLPAHVGHERRARVAALALVVLSLPLLLVGGLPAVTGVVLVLGVAVAPYMIAIFSLGERVVPAHRVGTAMTLLAAATGVGYALGSSIAGRLGDTGGSTAAFTVTVGASVLALLLMTTQQGRLRRAVAEHAPVAE